MIHSSQSLSRSESTFTEHSEATVAHSFSTGALQPSSPVSEHSRLATPRLSTSCVARYSLAAASISLAPSLFHIPFCSGVTRASSNFLCIHKTPLFERTLARCFLSGAVLQAGEALRLVNAARARSLMHLRTLGYATRWHRLQQARWQPHTQSKQRRGGRRESKSVGPLVSVCFE